MQDGRCEDNAFFFVCYLLDDVLERFAGDFTPGEIVGKPVTQKVYLGMDCKRFFPLGSLLPRKSDSYRP